jgi:hypothetical protein
MMEIYNCFKMKSFFLENCLNFLEGENSGVGLFHVLIVFVTKGT